MSEYIGTTSRCTPGSVGVKPSVARTTTSARTTPRVVVTRPCSIAVTSVPSWIVTPRRATAAPSPTTSENGCSAAQCGV